MNEQDYARTTFDEVASNYDEIELFKISAEHMSDVIQMNTAKRTLNVLDVACGTGNVVLECASVLKESKFDAVDISEGMLAIAKANAKKRKLDNVDFHLMDIAQLDLNKTYDVITCSYAMFFLDKAPQVLKSLVAMLNPNGVVIFTTFKARTFNPSTEIILPLLEKYGSQRAKEYDINDWKNLRTTKDIERLTSMALVNDMKMHGKDIGYDLSIDGWWDLMNNTSFKGMLMELTPENYEHVKSEYYEAMLKHADMDGEVELFADSYFVVVS